jgi:hypothetical protein
MCDEVENFIQIYVGCSEAAGFKMQEIRAVIVKLEGDFLL